VWISERDPSIAVFTVRTMSLPFRYYLRVRYGECDAQKVVFNARYGDYVDVAVNELLRALGLGDQLIGGPLDFQLVKQTTEWKGSARFDQVLELQVSAGHLGNTSFTLKTEFRVAGDPALLASVETVYVLVESATLKKIALPPDVRSALLAGAAGQATDHAGFLP
jgi:acyl-CoA thioester hydrolase